MEYTNLVLDEELDTLDGSGSSLGDGSGDTTHCCPMSANVSLVSRALIGAGTQAPSMRYRGAASGVENERTHEVNDEAGHAHELLLALAVMVVSMFPDGAPSSPEAGRGRWFRRATHSTSLVAVPMGADILSVVLEGYMMEWRG